MCVGSGNNNISKTQTGLVFIHLQSREKNTVKQAIPVQHVRVFEEADTMSSVEIWRKNELHRFF